jgi:hypothetical protein
MSLKPAIAYACTVVLFCGWALAGFPYAATVLTAIVVLCAVSGLLVGTWIAAIEWRRWRVRRRNERRMGMLLDFNERMRP